jgi:UDP-N-acetylmuramoyl-L-alanyl-D-glutamate--2,6-diaminopimelate ligase
MKSLLKKIVPAAAVDRYHLALAKLSAARFGRPSERMVVVGVTGTNGKSTVCAMIARILDEAGYRTGFTTTVSFKVAEKEWLNDTKMTMLGRFRLQRLLAEMAAAGCDYAVVETSSEGIKQHRHAGVHYDAAVFTNLTPEHIESHGGFENYKKAKGELFAKLARDPAKKLKGKAVPKVIVANLDSPHGEYFLSFRANKKYGFLREGGGDGKDKRLAEWPLAIVKALDVKLHGDHSTFTVRGVPFRLDMPGAFNVENAMAAISYGLSQGVGLETMAAGLAKLPGVPGSIERVDAGQDFTVIVDYAPEPESFRKLYEVVATLPKKRVIHVLGSTGGGRDRDRRPVLGGLAAKGADVVIVTNEDPYDDEPMSIIEDVAAGARAEGKKDGEDLFTVVDRGEAIAKAVALAGPGDLVLLTGKGAEQAMCVADGKKIPWDDRTKVREAIARKLGERR